AKTLASVLLPEPFGPIRACTSPRGTCTVRPRTISCSPTETRRFSTLKSFIKPEQELYLRSPDLRTALKTSPQAAQMCNRERVLCLRATLSPGSRPLYRLFHGSKRALGGSHLRRVISNETSRTMEADLLRGLRL